MRANRLSKEIGGEGGGKGSHSNDIKEKLPTLTPMLKRWNYKSVGNL